MAFFERLRYLLNENPFKSNFVKNRMRPPGAVNEESFMERCIRCARCIAVCPYRCVHRAGADDGIQIGTPYIDAEERGCSLCMLCPPVCPTGALDNNLKDLSEVRMGIAVINEKTCLNHIYARDEAREYTDGSALYCNTCYNVCPLQDRAIILKDLVIPIITDMCTGCGICVECCPTAPRSVHILPTGMGDPDRAGLYHVRKHLGIRNEKAKELLEEKGRITGDGKEPIFEYNFNTETKIEGWQ